MTDSMSDSQQREVKKRPRPVISCLQCRSKKLKCDRLLPCQQCIKGGRTQLCAYADGQEPELRQNVEEADDLASKRPRLSTQSSSPSVHTEQRRVDEVLDRLKNLEKALQQQEARLSHNNHENVDAARDLDHDALEDLKQWDCSIRDFHIASHFVDALPSLVTDAELVAVAQEAYAIQASVQRDNVRLRAPHSQMSECISHMLQIIPQQKVCENLIDLYFQNFEHCSRILHRPTFIDQYRKSVTNTLPAAELQTFVPLFIGVLSIASLLNTLEECDLPAFHGGHDSVGAMELLRNWIQLQSNATRYSIPCLQVKLLLMLSMKLEGDDDRILWTTSGEYVREAMIMGLHEPSRSNLSTLEEEIRKRLWLTVCELDLAHAICIGMPANTPELNETRIPFNANDEDLLSSGSSKPIHEWTDGLCQHILGQTFNTRLKAYNYSFRPGPQRYSEVLNEAKALEDTISNLPPPFKLDQHNPPGRLVAQMEVDISLRRPLIALYTPFALAMPPDDRYKDARIGWVQANLVVLCFQDLFDPKFPAIEVPRPDGYWDLYYTVYREADVKGLHAQVLELQRMKDVQSELGRRPHIPVHTHRSGSRALGWSIKGIGESIEDTLNPLVRRIGRKGSDLALVLRYQLVYDSLRCEKPEDLVSCIRSGLDVVLKTVRANLYKKGHEFASDGHYVTDLAALQWFARFLLGEDEARR